MSSRYPRDLEAAKAHDVESEPLLDPSITLTQEKEQETAEVQPIPSKRRFTLLHLIIAFFGGILLQLVFSSTFYCSWFTSENGPKPNGFASGLFDAEFVPPYIGSTEVDQFPPSKPTNVDPSLFPSNIGYAGPTPTGAEPALLVTAPAYPVHSGAPGLLSPAALSTDAAGNPFDLFRHWGNLSPWYSNPPGTFGVESGPEPPAGCSVTGLHMVHRHGARYPTGYVSYGGPASFASKLHDSGVDWEAKGDLSFLNDWTYKLGEEVLTPFGRHQLFDLGYSTRMKYGFLLKNFTDTLPVFRTESQDRMVASAMNFAIGFFGYPFDGQYEQSITIEAEGFNNTLAPYDTCPNANDRSKGGRGSWYAKTWAEKYLQDAQSRINAQLDGLDLEIEEVYSMQQMCAYETVALGYSKFCELFTSDEWESFDYSMDLSFYYGSGFGAPMASVQGVGYIQELVARLTQTPIETHNSSTNATLNDNPVTFPLDGRSLYVDATHEVVIMNILTALNLTTLTAGGPLPVDHIPEQKSWVAHQVAPFASNIQFQLLSCGADPSSQIRVIVNDGVVPLAPLKGCADDLKYGMCSVDGFVDSMRQVIAEVDWLWDCHGDWTVPEGDQWHTTIGRPPKKGE